ncbi:MAG: 30S ribosomal protein S17 [Candidatus Micrarchaeota archaeon]
MADEMKPEATPVAQKKPQKERKQRKGSPIPEAEKFKDAGKDGCNSDSCPLHGSLRTRGRIYEGLVVGTKARKTAIVVIQYLRKVPKYERFEKRHSKLHVHIPDCYKVTVGDTIKFMECRKLSKTKTFVIID